MDAAGKDSNSLSPEKTRMSNTKNGFSTSSTTLLVSGLARDDGCVLRVVLEPWRSHGVFPRVGPWVLGRYSSSSCNTSHDQGLLRGSSSVQQLRVATAAAASSGGSPGATTTARLFSVPSVARRRLRSTTTLT